jgi:flagellar hook-associated protein 2
MGITNTGTSALSNLLSNGGLGQGLNVQQLVSQQLQADSGPLTLLESEQTQLNSQTSALNTISADLVTLQGTVQSLTSLTGGLSSEQANSSDTSIMAAAADTTAQQAVHNIVVSSLATTASYYTNPATLPASGTTTLATGGSFTIKAGSNSATITINGTNNTLQGLASAINTSAVGGSVNASVIQDSTGARLAIVSNASGAPGDFTITDTGNSTGLNFTKPVSGVNASLTVDGVPISSATNTVTGVLQGVTLNLAGANPGETVTLSVQPDAGAATSAINQFVTAYNQVVSDLNSQFAVNPVTGNAGILSNDSTLSLVQDQLFGAINFSQSGTVANLGSIGLNLQNDGTIQVDSASLANSLQSNFAAVQTFFQSTTARVGQALNSALSNLTDATAGPIALDLQGISQQSSDITSQVADIQYNLSVEQQNLVNKYSQVNVVLEQLPVLQQQISQQLAGA